MKSHQKDQLQNLESCYWTHTFVQRDQYNTRKSYMYLQIAPKQFQERNKNNPKLQINLQVLVWGNTFQNLIPSQGAWPAPALALVGHEWIWKSKHIIDDDLNPLWSALNDKNMLCLALLSLAWASSCGGFGCIASTSSTLLVSRSRVWSQHTHN